MSVRAHSAVWPGKDDEGKASSMSQGCVYICKLIQRREQKCIHFPWECALFLQNNFNKKKKLATPLMEVAKYGK